MNKWIVTAVVVAGLAAGGFVVQQKYFPGYEKLDIVIVEESWFICVDLQTGEVFRFDNRTTRDGRAYPDGNWRVTITDATGKKRYLERDNAHNIPCQKEISA